MEKLSNARAFNYAVKIKSLELQLQDLDKLEISLSNKRKYKNLIRQLEDITEEICDKYGEEGLVKVDIKMSAILKSK